MKNYSVYIALLFFLFLQRGICQDIFDQSPYTNLRAYTSLAAAMQHPDSVQKLDLSKKKLTDFPLEIMKLKNLKVLNLGKNKIRLIPKEIGELQQLEDLILTGNKLTVLPEEIGLLKNLRRLDLSRNDIVSLPPEVGKLQNLEVLDLWDNELSDLPDEIRNLTSLRYLDMRSILFTEVYHKRFHALLPNATIFLSPSCTCKN